MIMKVEGVKLRDNRENMGYCIEEVSIITRIGIETILDYEESGLMPDEHLRIFTTLYKCDYDSLIK